MEIPKVYEAIAAAMADISKNGISKDRKNAQQGYNFRGIDDVYNTLSPILARHSLMMLPRIIDRHCVERTSAKGGVLFYTTVDVEFDIVCGIDGSRHTIRTVGEAMDSADKSSNKAMSAAMKYAALMTFMIPTEGDNDADETTHEVKPVEVAKAKPMHPGSRILKEEYSLNAAQLAQYKAACHDAGVDFRDAAVKAFEAGIGSFDALLEFAGTQNKQAA